ncbi:hypothetical protein SVAN01_08690 [Stagonosporopsis vannaccii]|nr:hypothetical protein SVAN01_08690 [Stagonosporopsis vannaccii]
MALERAVSFAAGAVLASAVALVAFDRAEAVASRAFFHGPVRSLPLPNLLVNTTVKRVRLPYDSRRIRQLQQKPTAHIAGSTREITHGVISKQMVGPAWRNDDVDAGPSSSRFDPSAARPLSWLLNPRLNTAAACGTATTGIQRRAFDRAGRAILIRVISTADRSAKRLKLISQSSSAFLVLLHPRIMLLIRLLPGLMPEPKQLPLSNRRSGRSRPMSPLEQTTFLSDWIRRAPRDTMLEDLADTGTHVEAARTLAWHDPRCLLAKLPWPPCDVQQGYEADSSTINGDVLLVPSNPSYLSYSETGRFDSGLKPLV